AVLAPPPCLPRRLLLPYTTLFRSARGAARPGRRDRPSGAAGRGPARARPTARPQAGGALRWPAAACGARSRPGARAAGLPVGREMEEHTSELQSRVDLVCRLLLEK